MMRIRYLHDTERIIHSLYTEDSQFTGLSVWKLNLQFGGRIRVLACPAQEEESLQ
jgi:hypothetical protein